MVPLKGTFDPLRIKPWKVTRQTRVGAQGKIYGCKIGRWADRPDGPEHEISDLVSEGSLTLFFRAKK